jgi:hypothetical protein
MAATMISIKVTDVNGVEKTKKVAKGAKLSTLLSSGQTGLINGEAEAGTATLRRGDHVEINPASGKAA